ncbi:hypothetical protein SH449x_000147 [Pirellulaceae bacterium SH449]
MAKFNPKRLAARLVLLTAAILGLLLAAPLIVSKSWFYGPFIESFAKDRFALNVGSMKLSWFRPIEIHSITLSESGQEGADNGTKAPLIAIDTIKTDRGLVAYLWNGRRLGKVSIHSPVIDIDLLENETNLERIVRALKRSTESSNEPTRSESSPFDIEVSLIDATIQVTSEGSPDPLVVVPPFNAYFSYRSIGQEPILEIKPTTILNETQLTQALVRLGLGHAVPLLAKSAWFDGRVSLSCGQITVPLDRPIDSTGSAILVMHEVRTGPTEPLIIDAIGFLSALRNQEIPAELVFVDGSEVEIALRDQTISHSGLEAGLPKVDQRLQISSQGSVGLVNKDIDLLVKVPVPVEQLARREKVRELGVPQLTLPIRGTLDEPELDWTVFRKESGLVLALMSGQLQSEAPVVSGVVSALGGVAEGRADEAIDAAAALVQQIRERRQRRAEQTTAEQWENAENSENSRESRPSRRPMLDALRKAIR